MSLRASRTHTKLRGSFRQFERPDYGAARVGELPGMRCTERRLTPANPALAKRLYPGTPGPVACSRPGGRAPKAKIGNSHNSNYNH